MAARVSAAATMTATPIPIRAPDGSPTATRPGCAPRDGVLPAEDGPGLGDAVEGRADGSDGWEGRGDGPAVREGAGDGPGVRPPPGVLVPGRPGCGAGARCAPAGWGISSTQPGMIRLGSVRARPSGWGFPSLSW